MSEPPSKNVRASTLIPLLNLAFQTIPNVEKWEAVIRKLLAMTGARKGIMSLRSTTSADFVVPSGVLDSPLIVNFDRSFVQSFVEEYIAHDPWTPIERAHHPHLPYVLSTHIAPAELRRSKFWEWLEPQGIDDTIVAEVGRSKGTWVGLNLYRHSPFRLSQARLWPFQCLSKYFQPPALRDTVFYPHRLFMPDAAPA